MQGAIAAKLQLVLSDPEPKPDELRGLQRAFTRYLIRVDESAVEGERLLRRVVPRASLPKSANRTIGRLVDAGLLTTKQGTIELAHERLIDDWPSLPLKTWLFQDATDRRLIDLLRQRVDDETLPDGLLAQAEELLQRDRELRTEHPGLLDLAQRSRGQKRMRELLRRGAIGALVLLTLAAGAATWFAKEGQKAAMVAEANARTQLLVLQPGFNAGSALPVASAGALLVAASPA